MLIILQEAAESLKAYFHISQVNPDPCPAIKCKNDSSWLNSIFINPLSKFTFVSVHLTDDAIIILNWIFNFVRN